MGKGKRLRSGKRRERDNSCRHTWVHARRYKGAGESVFVPVHCKHCGASYAFRPHEVCKAQGEGK